MKTELTAPHRCLGLRESITITVGTVIGVGLFTVGANAAGEMGLSVIFATLTALAISIYPALLYAEMGAALPLSGGTYRYASLGLGRPFGMLAGWNFMISMVSVAGGEALAFSFYLRTLLEALGLSLPFDDRGVASAAIVAFVLLAVRGVEMTGRIQNGFLFFFWGVTVVWILSMLPALRFESGFSLPGAGGFLRNVAMVWWCFAGFETVCAMGEEIKHPQVNLPRALFLAPFLVFAVNAAFQWVLVCTVPAGGLASLAQSAAPYAEGMRLAGVVGFPLILLCAGIAFGGDFSTLNASVTAPARYLCAMARDGALPACFSRLGKKHGAPVAAVLTLGGLMLLLVFTGSISYIASLSLFATLFYYIIGILSACGLRVKHPGLKRPYRAPFIWLGALVSILIYLLLCFQLDRDAVEAGLVWSAAGLLLYLLRRKKMPAKDMMSRLPDVSVPSPKEQAQMDREYRVWRGAVTVAAVAAAVLYLISFLLSR